MEDTLEFLKRQHRAAITERDRVSIELQVWNLSAKKKEQRRGQYVRDALGLDINPFDIEQRFELFGFGDAAIPLWQRVEEDMTARTALDLIRAARATKRPGEDIEDAVAREIAEYDSRPNVRHLKNGKIVRQRSPTRLFRDEPPSSRPAAPPARVAVDARDTRTFWSELRSLVGGFMREQLKGHDEAIAVREVQRLERDIKIVIEDVQKRLGRIKAGGGAASMTDAIAKRRLTDACGVLRVVPPKDGIITDSFFSSTRRNFKQLAREYHADTAGDATRSQYQSVVEAWQAVQDCLEYQQHKGSSPA